MVSHRRPADYDGGEGWQSRVVYSTLFGGIFGSVGTAAFSFYKGMKIFPFTALVGSNVAICAACLSGCTELVRELRSAPSNDIKNVILGGIGSGAILGRLHGGPSRAFSAAIVFSTVGALSHLSYHEARELRLYLLERRMYGSSEVEPNQNKDSEHPPVANTEKNTSGYFSIQNIEFPEWFPIQKVNDETAAYRKKLMDERFARSIDSLHKDE